MSVVMPCELDHLVIGARSLEEGRVFIGDLFGVLPQDGGKHPKMGTHNVLLGLDARTYLEVIAIDPEGDAPEWPRWFSLDDQATQRALEDGPQLLTWVVRTHAISRLASLAAYEGAEVRHMSRGHLNWQFAFSADGRRLAGGVLPHVIQWQGEVHPADHMASSGCRLAALGGRSSDFQRINATIAQMNLQAVLTCEASEFAHFGLQAEFETPNGIVLLQ